MTKVLRTSDIVKVDIGEVKFYLSPLTNARKIEIASCTKRISGQDIYDHASAQHLYIKYSLKKIEGVKDYHGEDYSLSFEGESLTDECVSEVFMIKESAKMKMVGWQILNGLPDKITDENNKELEGVKLEVMKGLS